MLCSMDVQQILCSPMKSKWFLHTTWGTGTSNCVPEGAWIASSVSPVYGETIKS